jgi:ferric-dicitrate binding protein FerR (iron transport regulator)
MSDNHDLIVELILKYTRGEQLTTKEARVLEAWRAKSPDHQSMPDLFSDKEWVEERRAQMAVVPTEEIWERVRRGIGKGHKPAPMLRSQSWRMRGVAAALVMLLGLGIPLYYQTGKRVIRQQAQLTSAGIRIPNPLEGAGTLKNGERRVSNSDGHAKPDTLRLPDGSKVVLAYGSELWYADGFKGGRRDVYITGQAHFEVEASAANPFIVHFGQAVAQVTGTDFNVMAYPNVLAEVTLFSGKVKVVQGDKERVLRPSQQVVVARDSMPVRTLDDPSLVVGWEEKDPFFAFNHTDLMTVLRRFADWYHVTAINPENIKGAAVTGTFQQEDPLDSNLAQLGIAERQSARIKRSNDTIFPLPWDARAAIKYQNH